MIILILIYPNFSHATKKKPNKMFQILAPTKIDTVHDGNEGS